MSASCGYFGKLPDRADFVSGRCPDGFLKIWEPFVMGGLAKTREVLTDTWERAYMTMPVWRFWLTPETEGIDLKQAIAGALMPSVDKVGRKFPLTVAGAVDEEGRTGKPSPAWYDEVESILLGVLEEDAELRDFQAAVAGLSAPFSKDAGEASMGASTLKPDEETAGRLSALFWCHAGGGTYAFSCSGLPEPAAFRWLLLPEEFGTVATDDKLAGHEHGRYHPEDHRT